MTVQGIRLKIGTGILFILLLCLPPGLLPAQEFGFGFSEESDAGTDETALTPLTASPVKIGGEFTYAPVFLTDPDTHSLADSSSARLKVEASGTSVDALIQVKLSGNTLQENPRDIINEAFVRIFIKDWTIQGGWLKVFWGKADSQGPLDVLNPSDLTDLTITETKDRKIARPMLRISRSVGMMAKLEGILIPGMQGNRIAWDGIWEPDILKTKKALLSSYGVDTSDENDILAFPDTADMEYLQGGLRFTATAGPVDWGIQTFYGFLPTPSLYADTAAIAALAASGIPLDVLYNRYLQIGADSAFILWGLNFRSELAANLTEDMDGDRPDIYNPSLNWALGVDRDFPGEFSVNLQGSGSFRLMDSQVGTEAADIEADTEQTDTLITAIITKSFNLGRIELNLKALYGVEDQDYLIIPGVTAQAGDAVIECNAGFFGGGESSDFGQYRDNSFIKLQIHYSF